MKKAARSILLTHGRVRWIFLLLMLVLVTVNVGVFAKYVFRQTEEPLIRAKAFYFGSDLLEVPHKNGEYPHRTLMAGSQQITFQLYNYPDALRTSEVDIAYTAKLMKPDRTELETKTGTILIDEKTETVTLGESLAAGTYLVEVTSSPYETLLKAEFVIPDLSTAVTYTVSDTEDSPVLHLTVRTVDYAGQVKLTWCAGVLPDNADPLMVSASGSEHTVTLATDSEYTFVFYKTDPTQKYTVADLTASAVG